MKRKRHSPEGILVELREADATLNAGAGMAQVLQHVGVVTEATYYRR